MLNFEKFYCLNKVVQFWSLFNVKLVDCKKKSKCMVHICIELEIACLVFSYHSPLENLCARHSFYIILWLCIKSKCMVNHNNDDSNSITVKKNSELAFFFPNSA
jgi:hypothetical protein